MSNDNKDLQHIYEEFIDGNDLTEVGRVIGKGTFGEVRDIRYKNKIMAGKLIKSNGQVGQSEEEKITLELRGQNIIKINKILTKTIGSEEYTLIIMEKAPLKDLGKLSEFYHKHNLLKLIFDPFEQKVGESLLRFYSRQIIDSLELLDNNYCIHYDIKPENFLIAINLIIKLSDFSLLKKVKNEKTKIPGGTPGFLTPEYYIDRNVTSDVARKQDYFALGSTLFFLKFGELMLKYKKSDDDIINENKILNLLQYQIGFMKSRKLTDKDFIDFLTSLIDYNPNDRPSFEQIYRNKWLNKDVEYIDYVLSVFENDEEKIIMELQKGDFLTKQEKRQNENAVEKNKEKNFKTCRFRFKKKKQNDI